MTASSPRRFAHARDSLDGLEAKRLIEAKGVVVGVRCNHELLDLKMLGCVVGRLLERQPRGSRSAPQGVPRGWVARALGQLSSGGAVVDLALGPFDEGDPRLAFNPGACHRVLQGGVLHERAGSFL
jgi:hypothetical protein